MAAKGTHSVVFIDDATADTSGKMKSEVCRSMLSAYAQPKAEYCSLHYKHCFILFLSFPFNLFVLLPFQKKQKTPSCIKRDQLV